MKCFRLLLLLAAVTVPAAATAQTTTVAVTPAPPPAADPDVRVDPLQPDFNLAALPTTLRMPLHKLAFRVTHRFNRPLGQGDFGDLASDFFGLDSGAQIGLELRYGLARGTQVGVHRTSDRTIQIFGDHNFWSERNDKPFGLDAMATLEGADNLTQGFKSALGIVASRNVGRWAALYAEPFYVINSNPAADQGSDNNTLMVGFGARLRIRPSTYLVGEITPRLTGFAPAVNQMSFGLEGRAGGHLFQLNISNGFGTTLGQLADGGFTNDNWFIGFNIARKFF
jgi:hypothetical protein